MKKGVFTIMNYLMPKQGVLSMHCSATEGQRGRRLDPVRPVAAPARPRCRPTPSASSSATTSTAGPTTASSTSRAAATPRSINLSAEQEPDIFNAIRFGSVLENVVYDPSTAAQVDFADTSITQNTRGVYPIEYIDNAKIPCVGGHPKNVIFLTCDAFGVLPPVAKLTPAQAMYHFISGYTAKVAGTEVGVTEPEATFSPCFGGPFLVWHPTKYAELLAEQDREARRARPGWSTPAGPAAPYGVGSRMKLAYTRAIIDAIHAGELDNAATVDDPIFGLAVPTACPGVPSEILDSAEHLGGQEGLRRDRQEARVPVYARTSRSTRTPRPKPRARPAPRF